MTIVLYFVVTTNQGQDVAVMYKVHLKPFIKMEDVKEMLT